MMEIWVQPAPATVAMHQPNPPLTLQLVPEKPVPAGFTLDELDLSRLRFQYARDAAGVYDYVGKVYRTSASGVVAPFGSGYSVRYKIGTLTVV